MAPEKLFNRHFFLLFQGQLVSQIGSSVYLVALVFWIKHATDSPTLVGLLAMAAMIPGVLLGPFGGTFADHYSRKKIIVYGDIINGVFICSTAAVMFLRPDSVNTIITLLFFAAIINGTVMAVFRPATAASIPDIVPPSSVTAANGLIQSSVQIATLIGQAAGGVIYRVLGAPVVMLIDGLTYLFSALSESFITIPQKEVEKAAGWGPALRQFVRDTGVGFRHLTGSRGLRDLFLVIALINFFTAPFGVLLPFFVEDTLGSTPDWFGYIIAGMAFGSLSGSILAGAIKIPPRHKGAFVVAVLIILGGGFIAFGYSPTPLVALLILMTIGVFAGLMNVNLISVLQLATPSEIRGRMFGLLGTLTGGLVPISMGLAGVVMELVNRDLPLLFALSGLCVIALTPLLIFSKPFHEFMAFDADKAEAGEGQAGSSPPPSPSPTVETDGDQPA